MVFRLLHCLVVSVFMLSISASDGLQCRLTTNVGNVSDSVADLGKRLILNCSNIDKNDSVVVEWKKHGDFIKNKSSSILFINNLTRQDAGRYQCILTKGHQRSECEVCVKINVRLHVTFGLYDETERKMKLPCFVHGYPKPNAVVWYKNGRKISIKKGQSGHNYFVKNTVNGCSYQSTLETLYPDISNTIGNYTCEAKNRFGTARFSLYVSKKMIEGFYGPCPIFKDPLQEKNITVYLGKSKTLLCHVIFHDSNLLAVYDITNRTSNDQNHIYTSYIIDSDNTRVMNYTIVNAMKSDTGVYHCLFHGPKHRCAVLLKTFYITVIEPEAKKKNEAKKENNSAIVIAVSITGALVGLGLALVIWYLRGKRLKSLRFYDSVPELRWDVFVSYSSEDFLFVKELCKTLEQPPFNLIICLHQRDWELGRTVIDNMVDSVYCSQKTLIILSKSYLESRYCMQELQIAMHSEIGPDNLLREKIVLVKIDDVSLQKLPRALRQKSYLDYSNQEQVKHFKTKLLRALPRRELTYETTEDLPVDSCNNDTDLRLQEIPLT